MAALGTLTMPPLLAGIAVSAVLIVLPLYLYDNYKNMDDEDLVNNIINAITDVVGPSKAGHHKKYLNGNDINI